MMAELHLVGTIASARNFQQPRLFCKWSFSTGNIVFTSTLDFLIHLIKKFWISAIFRLKIKFTPTYIFFSQLFSCLFPGSGWKIINGSGEGQTQECCDPFSNKPVWDHPVDLHFATQTLQGSPKILLQVFCRDNFNRILFVSYGVCSIPLKPGFHSIDCHTWKPIGKSYQNIDLFFFFFLKI